MRSSLILTAVGIRDRLFAVYIFHSPFPPLFTLLVYGSTNLIVGFNADRIGTTIYGEDYWNYAFSLLFMYGLVLYELIRKWKQTDGIHRWQLEWFFIAIVASGAIGFAANLVFPYFFSIAVTAWIGPSSSMIWSGISLYCEQEMRSRVCTLKLI